MSSDDLFGERRIEYRGRTDDQPQDAYSFGAVDAGEESPFDFDGDDGASEVRATPTRSSEPPRRPRYTQPQGRAARPIRRSHLQAVPTPVEHQERPAEDHADATNDRVAYNPRNGEDTFESDFDDAFDDAFDEFDDFEEQQPEDSEDFTDDEPPVQTASPEPPSRNAASVGSSRLVADSAAANVAPTPAVTPEPRDAERIAGVTTGKRVPNHSYASPDLPTPERKSFFERLTKMFPAKKTKGPTTDELRFIRRNLTGSFNISVVNVKGGVGKTVTADLLGKTFSSQRNDRVIAVDATPEGGELIDRCRNENNGTIRSLIEQLPLVSRYSHIREHTSQSDSGLEVLGSDPSVIGAQRLTGDEYRAVMKALRTYYQVIVTDCAQGVTGELMESVLDETDLLLLVSEGADGMRAATKTANDLASPDGYWGGRYSHLVEDMVVVVNSRSPRSNVDVGKVEEFFSSIARAVVTLPFDQALEGGRGVELSEVSEATRAAGIDLASKIAASSSFKDGGR